MKRTFFAFAAIVTFAFGVTACQPDEDLREDLRLLTPKVTLSSEKIQQAVEQQSRENFALLLKWANGELPDGWVEITANDQLASDLSPDCELKILNSLSPRLQRTRLHLDPATFKVSQWSGGGGIATIEASSKQADELPAKLQLGLLMPDCTVFIAHSNNKDISILLDDNFETLNQNKRIVTYANFPKPMRLFANPGPKEAIVLYPMLPKLQANDALATCLANHHRDSDAPKRRLSDICDDAPVALPVVAETLFGASYIFDKTAIADHEPESSDSTVQRHLSVGPFIFQPYGGQQLVSSDDAYSVSTDNLYSR